MRESYVPNFKVPERKGPSFTMWFTLLLCVALPPLGLSLLWGRARCPLRGKLWISSISLISMVVLMTLILNWREQATYVAPTVPVTYVYGGAPTPVPEAATAPEDPTLDAPIAADEGTDVIIPGNPMG